MTPVHADVVPTPFRGTSLCTGVKANDRRAHEGPINVLLSQEGGREIIETIIDGIERCVLTLVSG